MTIHVPRSASATLRHILRASTRESHEALDRRFSGMLEAVDFAAYRHFVQVSHACHGAIEAGLADTGIATLVPDWPQRSRMPSLEHDMQTMSLSPLAVPRFTLEENDLPGALGAAYVLEGSRLGARYIHRRFREAGVAGHWPAASFAFISGDESVTFRDFAEILNTVAFDEVQTSACIAGADRTFDFFSAAVPARPVSLSSK